MSSNINVLKDMIDTTIGEVFLSKTIVKDGMKECASLDANDVNDVICLN